MTRLFHAKISFINYVLLSALLAVAIYLVWQVDMASRQVPGMLICLDLLAMVIIVERMIHTTYTITKDGTLIVHTGRFSKDVVVAVADIQKIEFSALCKVGGLSLYSYLLITTSDGGKMKVRPNNEEDFVKKINRMRMDDEDDEEEND